MNRFLTALHDVWHFPVYSSGGSLVRLHQLIVAIVVLMVGMLVARRICRTMIQMLRHKIRIGEGTAQVIQRALFYGFMALTALIALPMAGIPVTVFTVLGGALAIGFGFGAQNLFNNLMSGVILLFEQPIRVGDIVEVDMEIGKVEEIGNRCVRLRRPDGADLLLPNSRFLEQRVINWSLFDENIRGRVTVGTAYGSDTDRVRTLLLQAARENEKVHTTPEPLVLFDNFGESALVFTLYFWCSVVRPMDLRKIESDLRFTIDRLFRDAGVVISFPQRDVHLNLTGPLPVQVQATSAAGPA